MRDVGSGKLFVAKATRVKVDPQSHKHIKQALTEEEIAREYLGHLYYRLQLGRSRGARAAKSYIVPADVRDGKRYWGIVSKKIEGRSGKEMASGELAGEPVFGLEAILARALLLNDYDVLGTGSLTHGSSVGRNIILLKEDEVHRAVKIDPGMVFTAFGEATRLGELVPEYVASLVSDSASSWGDQYYTNFNKCFAKIDRELLQKELAACANLTEQQLLRPMREGLAEMQASGVLSAERAVVLHLELEERLLAGQSRVSAILASAPEVPAVPAVAEEVVPAVLPKHVVYPGWRKFEATNEVVDPEGRRLPVIGKVTKGLKAGRLIRNRVLACHQHYRSLSFRANAGRMRRLKDWIDDVQVSTLTWGRVEERILRILQQDELEGGRPFDLDTPSKRVLIDLLIHARREKSDDDFVSLKKVRVYGKKYKEDLVHQVYFPAATAGIKVSNGVLAASARFKQRQRLQNVVAAPTVAEALALLRADYDKQKGVGRKYFSSLFCCKKSTSSLMQGFFDGIGRTDQSWPKVLDAAIGYANANNLLGNNSVSAKLIRDFIARGIEDLVPKTRLLIEPASRAIPYVYRRVAADDWAAGYVALPDLAKIQTLKVMAASVPEYVAPKNRPGVSVAGLCKIEKREAAQRSDGLVFFAETVRARRDRSAAVAELCCYVVGYINLYEDAKSKPFEFLNDLHDILRNHKSEPKIPLTRTLVWLERHQGKFRGRLGLKVRAQIIDRLLGVVDANLLQPVHMAGAQATATKIVEHEGHNRHQSRFSRPRARSFRM